MKYLICFLLVNCCVNGNSIEPTAVSKARMFSLSPEEMVFASKLSDENRHRFCYLFSPKERSLSMHASDSSLLPDQNVELVFSAATY